MYNGFSFLKKHYWILSLNLFYPLDSDVNVTNQPNVLKSFFNPNNSPPGMYSP